MISAPVNATIATIATIEVATAEEQVMHYVSLCRTFARNTAENIIRLGQTVMDASIKLTGSQLDQFLVHVGIDKNGSTYRKLRIIGEQADRFLNVLDHLPNNWTTVYALAKMERSDFDRLVEVKALSPTSTMGMIKSVLATKKEEANQLVLSISIPSETPEHAFQLEQEVKALVEEFGGRMRWSNQEMRNHWKDELLIMRMAA
jgi:hypothetical protein